MQLYHKISSHFVDEILQLARIMTKRVVIIYSAKMKSWYNKQVRDVYQIQQRQSLSIYRNRSVLRGLYRGQLYGTVNDCSQKLHSRRF